ISIEIAVRLHVLVVLLNQHVPVVVDLPRGRQARANIIDRIRVRTLEGAIVGGGISTQVVRRRAREITDGAGYVVDVTTAMIGERGGTDRDVVRDRHVDGAVDDGVGPAVGGNAVTEIRFAGDGVKSGLVGDVANHA